MVESIGDWLAVDVPFAGMVGSVSGLAEPFREQFGPGRAAAGRLIATHGLAAFCRALLNMNELIYLD